MNARPDIPALLARLSSWVGTPTCPAERDLPPQLRNDLRALLELYSATHEARVRAEAAIRWALGEGDSDFGDHMPEHSPMPGNPGILRVPPYWWRDELRRRAALSVPQGEK